MIPLDKRSIAYQKRAQLTSREVQEKSERIIRSLIPYLKGCVGIYLAYGKEVDVTSLMTREDISCCVPKTFSDHSMVFYQVDQDTVYEKSSYGIREPKAALEIQKNQIDVMIIPMVVFDEQRNRMGHGKGFYDRYLKDYQGLKIGVAFECQKAEKLIIQPHDIPMDLIITEDAVYQ